jgi:hypothetical protein
MNRRELAKNGFLGLFGKLPKLATGHEIQNDTLYLTIHGTDTNQTTTVAFWACVDNSKWRRQSNRRRKPAGPG